MNPSPSLIERDEWTTDGPRITDAALLETLAKVLEHESWVIVVHYFYRGSSAPDKFIVDDYDELKQYLDTKARPGDKFWFWHFDQCCRSENALGHGKQPDDQGRTPRKGSY